MKKFLTAMITLVVLCAIAYFTMEYKDVLCYKCKMEKDSSTVLVPQVDTLFVADTTNTLQVDSLIRTIDVDKDSLK